jgi:hypothetical protein
MWQWRREDGKKGGSGMAKTDKPNILVIWGDDIGTANLSCYTHGLMGNGRVWRPGRQGNARAEIFVKERHSERDRGASPRAIIRRPMDLDTHV